MNEAFAGPTPRQPAMPKFGDDKRPARFFYSLEEAASIANCKAVDLLHYGGIGRVNLVVAAPDGLDVLPYDAIVQYVGAAIFSPELLVLNQAHCRKIECIGSAVVSDFRRGYLFDVLGPVQAIQPSNSDPRLTGRWCVWQVLSQGVPSTFRVTIDRIFVMALDLDAFLKGTHIPENDVPPIIKPHFQEYKSDKLVYMNQAALKFWGSVDPGQRAGFRKNSEVAEWLAHPDRGFSLSAATLAASLIRPEYAGTGGRPPKEK
jgi:hypothetical protein